MFCQEYWKDMASDLSSVKTNPKAPEILLPVFFSLMKLQDFQLVSGDKNEVQIHFKEYMRAQDLPFNLLWTFRLKKDRQITIEISPYYLELHGCLLKMDDDLLKERILKLLTVQNTQLHLWLILLTADNQVFIRSTIHTIKHFIQAQFTIRQQAKNIFKKIISFDRSYANSNSFPSLPSHPSIIGNKKCVSKDISRVVIDLESQALIRFRLTECQNKKRLVEGRKLKSSLEQQYRLIQKQKSKAKNEIRDYLNIMSLPHSGQINYVERVSKTSTILKGKNKLNNDQNSRKKNFYGVRILKKYEKDHPLRQSDHNNISKMKCELLFLNSIHAIKNQVIEATQSSYGYEPDEFKKKLSVVVKRVKGTQPSIFNQDQIDFLFFLRKFPSSKYISTYYLQETQQYDDQYKQCMMDYYGKTFDEFCSEKPTIASRLDMMHKIIKGVKWIEEKGLCHRNIRPRHIMVDDCDNPKIIDFSLCCSNFMMDSVNACFGPTQKDLDRDRQYYASYWSYQRLPLKKKLSKNNYNRHPQFDIYSLGRLMDQLLKEVITRESEPALNIFLSYLSKRCSSLVPEARPTIHELEDIVEWLKQSQINHFTSMK